MLEDGMCALLAAKYYNYRDFGYSSRPTQEQLARENDKKRWEVVEAIKRAEEEGWVTFHVESKGSRDQVLEYQLGTALAESSSAGQTLDETAIRVVKLPREIPAQDFIPLRRWAVGQMAAELVFTLILKLTKGDGKAGKRNEAVQEHEVVIGLSWGRTLQEMVKSTRSVQDLPCRIVVVPTVGGFGIGNVDMESASLARQMCQQLSRERATWYDLPAPGYVITPGTQRELLGIPLTNKVVGLWERAHILISGIGGMIKPATALELADWLEEGDLPMLRHLGAVGDISLHFFREDGTAIDIAQLREDPNYPAAVRQALRRFSYPVAAKLKHLHDAAVDPNRYSVAVGAGPGKAEAFLGAVNGQYIDGLVTDSHTAEEILKQVGPSGSARHR